MDNKQLTLGSLFDGSGGFPLGGILAGIKPVWNSEIEPFPIRVTEKRLPEVKHYGDVNKLNGAELPPVDIITFGSPCQDMSIAGKRTGLEGSRSGLFYQAIRIIKEMRCKSNGKYPRYAVWENVFGAFSSNKGEDFRAVLESFCSVKGCEIDVAQPAKWHNAGEILGDDFSVAWRVFDSQYWGIPQRRKRIYLVADFDGTSAGKILFESEGLSRYSAESFRAWQAAARCAPQGSGTAGIGIDGYNGAVSDKAATLGINCGMSTGRNGAIVLNDQGGDRMDLTEEKTCTLRAEAHHPPVVLASSDSFVSPQAAKAHSLHCSSSPQQACGLPGTPLESAGFCTEHSAKSRSIGYEEEMSPTLRAGVVPAAVCFENHSQDTRYRQLGDIAPTVLSTYGTGGNNQPFVVHTPKTLKIRGGCDGGGKGALIQDDKSATLGCNNDQTVFVPAAYGICSKDSNSMKSENPKSGFYKAETSRTLDGNGGNPSCNQGGIAVVAIEGNGTRPSHHGNGYSEEGVGYTLNATEQHGIAYGIDRATYNMGRGCPVDTSAEGRSADRAGRRDNNAQYAISIQEEVEPTIVAKGPGAVAHPTYCTSKSSFHTRASEEVADTLVASDFKDPPTVNDTGDDMEYIVRRLTPTECARLQGFPDFWCSDLESDDPTDEEIAKWREIFKEYDEALGKKTKPKSDNQIRKWLKDPHSDSAEYKMWGNGVSLPIVLFVLAGIAYYSDKND